MHMLKLKETFQKHQSLVYLAIGAKLNCTGSGAKFVGIVCRGVAQPGSAHAWGA